MEEIRLTKLLFQEAKPSNDACPTPSAVLHSQHIDLQHIARLGAVDADRSGQGMNPAPVDGQKIFHARIRCHLATARVKAAHMHRISRRDGEPRLERAVPARMCGLSGQPVFSHAAPYIATVICNSTSALRGRALTPTAARTWRPCSPNTATNRSEAPLMTAGESGKLAIAFT